MAQRKRNTASAAIAAARAATSAPPVTAPDAVLAPLVRASFQVENWPLERIKRYAQNPRKNEAAIGKVARALRDFGWRQPLVVDAEGVIIVGDTRYLAAQLLKQAEVPVHVARDLSPAKIRTYRLADNRVHEEAGWDLERLVGELRGIEAEGFPLEGTGFDEAELRELMGGQGGLQPHADPEELPEVPETPVTKLGDRITLGHHVLLCADATTSLAWERLLAGERVAMLWTDPPYDVDYTGKTKRALKIGNDALGHDGTVKLLRALLGLAMVHLVPGGGMYVFAPHGPEFYAFAKVATELGFWRQTVLWVKDSFAFGRSDFHYRHEAVVVGEAAGALPFADEARDAETVGYGWRPGDAHQFYGGRKLDTVWEVDRPRASEDHPTAKPVALAERAMLASSKAGDVVADCCAGSGPVVIAAEMHGRRARVIELDPRYCDAIVRRWEAATGRVAVRESLEAPSSTTTAPSEVP